MSANVLKVEPDWRRICETRLYWFVLLPGITAVIARIAPLRGSIAISADDGSLLLVSVRRIARLATFWSRGSIVV